MPRDAPVATVAVVYYLDRFYKAPCVAVTVNCALLAAFRLAPSCRPARICVWPDDVPKVVEIFCEGGPPVKLMEAASPELLSQYYAGEKECFDA